MFSSGFILVMCAACVSGVKFKCHRDICDTSWQFCNDGEERCNTCTPEQCEPDVAKHIFNQCQTFCEKESKSSAQKVASTTTSSTTDVTLPVQPQESFWILILTLVILLVVCTILILVGIGVRYLHQIKTNQQTDAEKGSSIVSYATLQTSGQSEKEPLLERGIQPTDSGLHANKVEDIQILAEAASNVNSVDNKQPSAPPSYSTDDNLRDHTMMAIPCENDLQSGGNHQVTIDQDHSAEKLGDTNLLSKDLLSTNSSSSDDSTCITRPKIC